MSAPKKEPIIVHAYYDAPDELRGLSPHAGDEDWLAELPPDFDGPPLWMDEGTPFGCCDVSWHDHPSRPGWHVAIGAHA